MPWILTAAETPVDQYRMLSGAPQFKRTMLDEKHSLEEEFLRVPAPPLRATPPPMVSTRFHPRWAIRVMPQRMPAVSVTSTKAGLPPSPAKTMASAATPRPASARGLIPAPAPSSRPAGLPSSRGASCPAISLVLGVLAVNGAHHEDFTHATPLLVLH